MTQHELYTFILCLIVFVALTALFSALLTIITRLILKQIRAGMEDAEILKEYQDGLKQKKQPRAWEFASAVFSGIVCVLLFAVFFFSVTLHLTEGKFTAGISSLKVVKSESMSEKHGDNRYLHDNGIDNHLQVYDLIVVEALPEESELALYDVVVYEKKGDLIIHRIVGIEEPNERHPDKRYFTLQGDAVKYKDEFPVTYDQMHAVWNGARIPFVGSFVMFMQSPAGWLCILLVLFALISTPLVEKKITREKGIRLQIMRYGARLPAKTFPSRMLVQPMTLSHRRLDLRLQKQPSRFELSIQSTDKLLKSQDVRREEGRK